MSCYMLIQCTYIKYYHISVSYHLSKLIYRYASILFGYLHLFLCVLTLTGESHQTEHNRINYSIHTFKVDTLQ